mgnify:FL=1|tara:strand:- start:593 stop:1318 length:726 start_codon:yes stop_codon:yes gene_type:complete
MKHIVLIKSNNPGKFNYCKFGNYKDREGRLKELIDINGIKVSGFEMFQAIVTLDINKEYDKRLYEFLKDHPLIRGKFTIEDISSNEQQKAKSSIESAKAITTASKLEERDLRDLSLILGVDSKMEEMLLRAKVIQIANENPEKFMSYLNDIDKEHRIFLKKALDKKILNKVNGVWKHNTLNIGLTEDQAIVWLKDNGDTYALLKHQLRTGKKEETKSLELEEVSQSKLNESSYIQEIENSK